MAMPRQDREQGCAFGVVTLALYAVESVVTERRVGYRLCPVSPGVYLT